MRTPLLSAFSAVAGLALLVSATSGQDPKPVDNPNLPKRLDPRPKAEAINEVSLGETLLTHAVPRGQLGPTWIKTDSAPMPLDRKEIWILDFAFKPMRMIEVEIPGKGRRKVSYLYYRVVNRTGKPRMFVPQFSLVTDTGKRIEDVVLPQAVKNIQAREDPLKDLLGAVSVIGMIPPSTKEGVDDAVYGVAVWDNMDLKADAFKIFVQGLSDGYFEVKPPDGAKPYTRYKAVRIDFARPGDERNANEREIRLLDPPYEWVYYP